LCNRTLYQSLDEVDGIRPFSADGSAGVGIALHAAHAFTLTIPKEEFT